MICTKVIDSKLVTTSRFGQNASAEKFALGAECAGVIAAVGPGVSLKVRPNEEEVPHSAVLTDTKIAIAPITLLKPLQVHDGVRNLHPMPLGWFDILQNVVTFMAL